MWDGEGATEVHQFIIPPIVRLLGLSGAKKILDLGCGNGFVSGSLSEKGFDMTGCDFSQSGIELAKRQFPNVAFFQHDISQPLPTVHYAQFDAVISTEVIEHLLSPRKLIENALSALKPNGTFIVTAPYHGYFKNLAIALTNGFDHHWHPLRDYGHIKFFSKDTLTQLFYEFNFEQMHFETVGRIPAFARSMIIAGVKK